MGSTELPGIYLHVPFCSSICPYCDFSVVIAGSERRAAYVEALVAEIDLVDEIWPACDTLYLGGGTPSALDDDQLVAIIEALAERGLLAESVRISMEVNPEDVTVARASRWRSMGIHTVSVGIQSFDDEVLTQLGRRHRRQQAVVAVDALKAAGLASVAIDLIFGLAGRDLAGWRQDLETAAALEVDHLSCYQLTVHSETLLGRRVAKGLNAVVDDTLQAELFRVGWDLLESFGYHGYEVSNFARSPAHRSRHNQKYWNHTPYLGLGPSAHSLLGRRRWWNQRRLRRWRQDVEASRRPLEGEEQLTDQQMLLETVMLRLRTIDGLDLRAVRGRFKVDLLELNQELISQLVQEGLMTFDNEVLRPSPAGLAVADGLVARFRLD